MPTAHAIVHRQDLHRLRRQPLKVAHDVRDHIYGPAVAQHFIRLRVTDGKSVCVRHGLEALALRHGQLADDVEAVPQLDGIFLTLDGDTPIPHLIGRNLLSICRLKNQYSTTACYHAAGR